MAHNHRWHVAAKLPINPDPTSGRLLLVTAVRFGRKVNAQVPRTSPNAAVKERVPRTARALLALTWVIVARLVIPLLENRALRVVD